MIAATRWTAAARRVAAVLVALLACGAFGTLGPMAPAAAGAQEREPGAKATVATSITAHNRAAVPVELWAGRVFLGRVEPVGAFVRSVPVERRASDGALAIIGVDRSDGGEAGDDAPAPGDAAAGPVYRASVIVLPGEMAASDELTIVWGGIDPIEGAAPTPIGTPG